MRFWLASAKANECALHATGAGGTPDARRTIVLERSDFTAACRLRGYAPLGFVLHRIDDFETAAKIVGVRARKAPRRWNHREDDAFGVLVRIETRDFVK